MNWTVEGRDSNGRCDPFDQPTFLFRRSAERYARRHSCTHNTYTVKRVDECRCGHSNVDSFNPPPPTGVDVPLSVTNPPADFDG